MRRSGIQSTVQEKISKTDVETESPFLERTLGRPCPPSKLELIFFNGPSVGCWLLCRLDSKMGGTFCAAPPLFDVRKEES